MEALEAHFKTPHMASFGAAISKIKPKNMNVKVYDVAGEVALPS
jgi:quinol monooxygenase YgiN